MIIILITIQQILVETNEGLAKLLEHTFKVVPDNIGLRACEDFHLSLTKTVILKHHWIESFVNTIKTNLSHFTKYVFYLCT